MPADNNTSKEQQEEAGPVEIPLGKVIAKRWKVTDKLGEGG
jgi:hypothetical protein